MPGAVGDLGTALGGGETLGWDAVTDQMAQAAAGRGLAALQAMNQNPMMMQPGQPPGAGPMPTQPTAPPMGGAPGMGPPPPQAQPQPQGANARLMGQGTVAYNPQPGAPPGSFAGRFPQTGQGTLPNPGQAQAPPGAMPPPPPQQQQPQQQMPPMPQGGMPGGPGAYSLQQIVQAVQKANPGAPPNVLMKAVSGLVPLMRPSDQEYWKMVSANQAQQRINQGEQRIQQTGELGQQKLGQEQQKIEQKERQFDANQERMKTATAIRQDQQWKALDLRRQQVEAQIKQGGQKQALSQWRAILDAQHKRAMEIIESYSAQNVMPPELRQQLLKDSNEAYEKAIKEMGKQSSLQGNTRLAGDIVPFPPSSQTPLGRKQIRDELQSGKANYESTLPQITRKPITIEDIKARVPEEEG